LPIRYQRDLTQALVRDFGVDREAYFHRVHGSRFRDLLNDKGYFFDSMTHPPTATTEPHLPPWHYLVDRGPRSSDELATGRVKTVGPYVVVSCRPLVDYDGWQCADVGSQEKGPDRMRDWVAVRLPTAREPDAATYGATPFRSWRSLPVLCRGNIAGPGRTGGRLQLVVSLRTWPENTHRVGAFLVNGERLTAQRVLAHTTFGARTHDAYFDLGDGLRPGRNDIAFRIEGRGLDFDLDVYETGR
jgi:hypothetical protein